jgi:hypothetical protein
MKVDHALLAVIESNRLLPSRGEVKRMVNDGKWHYLGRIFNFTPLFMTTAGGKMCIDWRCVPPAMADILRESPGMVKTRIKSCEAIKARRARLAPSFLQFTWEQQDKVCYYCKRVTARIDWSIDHKIPWSRGGTNAKTNKVGCCKNCNQAKSNMTDHEFLTIPPGLRKNKIRELAKLK